MRRRRAAARDFSKSIQQQRGMVPKAEICTTRVWHIFREKRHSFQGIRIATSAQFSGQILGTKIEERDCWLVARISRNPYNSRTAASAHISRQRSMEIEEGLLFIPYSPYNSTTIQLGTKIKKAISAFNAIINAVNFLF